ncbi:hypothetical protein J6590_076386, partial [Homalodisca vitripennis]
RSMTGARFALNSLTKGTTIKGVPTPGARDQRKTRPERIPGRAPDELTDSLRSREKIQFSTNNS